MAVPAPQGAEKEPAAITGQEIDRLGNLPRVHAARERDVRYPAVRDAVARDIRHVAQSLVHGSMKATKCFADDAEARQYLPPPGSEKNQTGCVDGKRQHPRERRKGHVMLSRNPWRSEQGDVSAVRGRGMPGLGR